MRISFIGVACFVALAPIVEGATTPFLDFPLSCPSATQGKCSSTRYSKGAYTPASMTSILDHHMEKAYDEDGIVTAFTGEEGRATAAKPKVNQGCYPQYSPNPGKPFVIKGLYIGTNDGCLADQGLNYDNHPAYDYVAETGTPVYAAASGRVVKIINKATGLPGRCVPKGIETGGCGIWCYVGIDHGNGYVTQYGHLSRIDVQSGDEIKAGALIGLTGQCSPPTKDKNGNVTKLYSVPPHFHFEVLKENAGSPYGYAFVDPYGWEGDPRNDPLEKATGIPNVRLWKTGVQANPADAKMPSKSNADVISRTMEATAIPTISAEKEAQQVGYAHLEKMLTKCNGLSYLKSRHLGNDRKEITDIREYKGTLRIVCHERPESNPAKGIEWSCAFEVNAPRERMNYHNEGWVTETHMPLMFGVTKAHGRWQADSSFQKVTCDEVQGSLANQVLQGIRNIDFRNFTYDLAPWCGKEFGKTRVRIKDGGYGSQTDWWFGIWEMPGYASIIYGDLTGDGRDEAIVTTSCGGMHATEEPVVFTMKDGRVSLMARLESGDRAFGGYHRITIKDGFLITERTQGKAACCPEFIERKTYRWSGTAFAQVGAAQRRPFK